MQCAAPAHQCIGGGSLICPIRLSRWQVSPNVRMLLLIKSQAGIRYYGGHEMSKADDQLKLLDSAYEELRLDPSHRLEPRRRQQIYEAIDSTFSKDSVSILGRLGCLAARRVLPLFEAEHPEDNTPGEILSIAEAYLAGKVDQQVAIDKLDLGHHASGNAWGYDEAQLSASAWLAANAAYHALSEALGNRPLRLLPQHHKAGQVLAWTDEDLCWLDIADTASVACMALVSSKAARSDHTRVTLDFWTWWLTEALPNIIKGAT